MSKLVHAAQLAVVIAANIAIVPVVLYNAYWAGEYIFGPGSGVAVAGALLLGSSLLSSRYNQWLVTLPAIFCSLVALVAAPWGVITGPSAFLCGWIALTLNPRFSIGIMR